MNVREILEKVSDAAMTYQAAVMNANACQTESDRDAMRKAETKLEETLDEAEKKLHLKTS